MAGIAAPLGAPRCQLPPSTPLFSRRRKPNHLGARRPLADTRRGRARRNRPPARNGRLGPTVNLCAGPGVAVYEFRLAGGYGQADYLLHVGGKAVGVVEAKPVGSTPTGVVPHAQRYGRGVTASRQGSRQKRAARESEPVEPAAACKGPEALVEMPILPWLLCAPTGLSHVATVDRAASNPPETVDHSLLDLGRIWSRATILLQSRRELL